MRGWNNETLNAARLPLFADQRGHTGDQIDRQDRPTHHILVFRQDHTAVQRDDARIDVVDPAVAGCPERRAALPGGGTGARDAAAMRCL